MFGYVVADTASLTPEQLSTYRSYYCGLCRCLKNVYGTVPRLTLNYDMTFLVLLFTSLYDLTEQNTQCSCIIHPFRKHTEIINEATYYAAAMNIALSYYKCVDDWRDDHSCPGMIFSRLLQKNLPTLRQSFSEKLDCIQRNLDRLSLLEAENTQDPDLTAGVFGDLLGNVFVWRDDRWSDVLYRMGNMLGQYIYLTDAVLDLPKDVKFRKYNPLCSRWDASFDKQTYVPILNMLLGECTEAFEQLPLTEHTDLLRNILYSGIWTKFYQNKRNCKEENHV